MNVKESIQLAQSLPPRLLRFFAKYPPPQLFSHTPSTITQTAVATSTISPAEPAAPQTDHTTPPVESRILDAIAQASTSTPSETEQSELPLYHNPFQPRKNFRTGKWIGPVYGLRKQADLVKLAQKYGVVDLLPYTVKKPGVKEQRRLENGLQVKGTGVGQKVKGKTWERTLKGKLEARRQAMLNMPALIQEWKQKGHGRGWKKWPK